MDKIKRPLILISFLLIFPFCNIKKESFESRTERKISSESLRQRREAIYYIKDKKFKQFSPQLILIIYNNQYSEDERYYASEVLAEVRPKRAMESIRLLFDNKDRILINCAIQMIITLKENQSQYNLDDYQETVYGHYLKYKDPISQQFSIKALGLLKYKKAYVALINRIIARKDLHKELLATVAYLGDEKKNKFIRKVLLHIESEYRDKRFTRSIRKALYILENGNSYNPLFDSRLMAHLNNLASDYFPHSIEGEAYFRLHHADNWKKLNRELGNSETYDPKKIDYILQNRFTLLKMALKDHNPKLRFKAVKLMADLGNESHCSDLEQFYTENKSSDVLKEITIEALAKLHCTKSFDLIQKMDKDPSFQSPLYYFFVNNPEKYRKEKEIFVNYSILFTFTKLFPDNKEQILYLLNHEDENIRFNCIYTLSKQLSANSKLMLEERLNIEENDSIKDIIRSILKPEDSP